VIDAVAAARQEREHGLGPRPRRRACQDAAAERDGGVGAKDDLVRRRRDGVELLAGDAADVVAGSLGLAGGFVDLGRADREWRDAGLREEVEAAWARGAKDQAERGVRGLGRHGALPVVSTGGIVNGRAEARLT
jgi:hypothetical protein